MFKILIVEDDKELSLLFQKVLEKSGYQVKSASDGAQALEVLAREYIDVYKRQGFTDSASRQYGMSSEARTKVAEAFLQEIYKKGYTPMFYAAMNELSENSQ